VRGEKSDWSFVIGEKTGKVLDWQKKRKSAADWVGGGKTCRTRKNGSPTGGLKGGFAAKR